MNFIDMNQERWLAITVVFTMFRKWAFSIPIKWTVWVKHDILDWAVLEVGRFLPVPPEQHNFRLVQIEASAVEKGNATSIFSSTGHRPVSLCHGLLSVVCPSVC